MPYTFTYRRKYWPFKQSIEGVYVHVHYVAGDKMVLSLEAGHREIRHWSNCTEHLGQDWDEEVKRREAAGSVPKFKPGCDPNLNSIGSS